MEYREFLEQKGQIGTRDGFAPVFMPDFLFDFQKSLVDWSMWQGRGAIFADCGLGKTPIQLVWAQNVMQKTNKPVLILTPLAVSYQTTMEGNKFDIEVKRSNDGTAHNCITITNYEQLHKFNANDFSGVVCDESSILKNYDGTRKGEITEFMKKMQYRLLCTATAAPNDFIELGTSSEALGFMGHIDMLNKYFKNDNNNTSLKMHYGEAPTWRLKGHAELPFWRYITSWARACRKPSDLGFSDEKFVLPPLIEREHLLTEIEPPEGILFNFPARSLPEQRAERKRTINERCEKAASLVADTGQPAILWCHLNPEGDLLEKLLPGCVQVSGSDSDEKKEEKFIAFLKGEARVLVTKPKIGAWGLNFQHCNHTVYFPSHSFEAKYQAVRRIWRFGQKRPVTVDIVMTEGEGRIIANLKRKEAQAVKMFDNLVREMNNSIEHKKINAFKNEEAIPSWL